MGLVIHISSCKWSQLRTRYQSHYNPTNIILLLVIKFSYDLIFIRNNRDLMNLSISTNSKFQQQTSAFHNKEAPAQDNRGDSYLGFITKTIQRGKSIWKDLIPKGTEENLPSKLKVQPRISSNFIFQLVRKWLCPFTINCQANYTTLSILEQVKAIKLIL